MGPLDLSLHLMSFAAPAVFLAVLLPVLARTVARPTMPRPYWLQVIFNAAAGFAVLAAGLAYFGRDGKMATYAALVIVMATSQWLGMRAWRR